MADDGSSPRGRGTPVRRETCRACGRFIPAWAGNATTAPGRMAGMTVHPRVGGERPGGRGPGNHLAGSSPRGRGTRVSPLWLQGSWRFIPAWAGNAQVRPLRRRSRPVHPRVGGERCSSYPLSVCTHGSSPRGRGTLRGILVDLICQRFIPAWAGNAYHGMRHDTDTPVHPRVGGERAFPQRDVQSPVGSSPRGRGTRSGGPRRRLGRRFIPAWAGNAPHDGGYRGFAAVHPRVGGERDCGEPGGWEVDAKRFIPAWAGNAPLQPFQVCKDAVHPRVGGERPSSDRHLPA